MISLAVAYRIATIQEGLALMMPVPFSSIPFVSDARVSPVMTHCPDCGLTLPEAQSTTSSQYGMLLFTLCHPCQRIYMLDWATFR